MSSTRSTVAPWAPMYTADSVPSELTGTTTLLALMSPAGKLIVDDPGVSVGSGPRAT